MKRLEHQTISILAIDDDPDDLAILEHHLSSMGDTKVELTACEDPRDGLGALQQRAFDVVLLDYQLGSATGLEVFAAIRNAGYDLPVLLLTERGDEKLAVRCLHSGMADYLPKEIVSSKSLGRSIQHAIDKNRLGREIEAKRRELENTVAELRAKGEEVERYHHTLSHELKTPLTGVREFISIVLEGLQGPLTEEQRQSLETAQVGCDQMIVLMNDVLDASRMETGKLAVNPRSSSLAALVRQSLAYCAGTAEEAGIELDSLCAAEVDQAWFDPARIQQVLTNLISNAVKFSEPGSRILVTTEPDKSESGMARVSVCDQGRGIPENDVDKVFERHYQVSLEDTAIRGGLGIGLDLCRQLVRLHGGQIRVESEVGVGTTFTFTLPRESARAAAVA